jgi:hypothetical protein
MNASRIRRAALAVLVLTAAAAAAVTLNVVLLARTSDQSGPAVLTPHVKLPAAPAWTVRPAHGPIGDRGADD